MYILLNIIIFVQYLFFFFFFFKQKTAYEMRISDWSSDVCSSDLGEGLVFAAQEKAGFRVVRRGGDVALLPFTGEGARRADEGSERSEPAFRPSPKTPRAARYARALIRCRPRPSPTSQENARPGMDAAEGRSGEVVVRWGEIRW